jgi:5'-AMP-activated protein kinase regulatory beta subunit
MAESQMMAEGVLDETPQLEDDKDNIVPTVFKWEHGGRNVYITGTFNNWDRQIPMHRSGNDFSYVHNLKKGKHAFKFIVDDEWRFAPDQPTVADVEGRVSNFIDVSEFTPYVGDANFFEKSKERKIPNEEFGQEIPDEDEYTKEPLALPPHLRHIILNKFTPSTDPLALPVPQHVSLNHLYCTAIKDGIMVLGATQRYKEKFFTVVFYSTMP